MNFSKAVRTILLPAMLVAQNANTKPAPAKPATITEASERTYYLGTNGRVSQRKHLVGELLATCRAQTTDHARWIFTQKFSELRAVEASLPKPYVGKLVKCVGCGCECAPSLWHDAKNKVQKTGYRCRGCYTWLNMSPDSVQTAPETLRERGVICDRASYTREVVR